MQGLICPLAYSWKLDPLTPQPLLGMVFQSCFCASNTEKFLALQAHFLSLRGSFWGTLIGPHSTSCHLYHSTIRVYMEEYASSCGGKERELSGIEDGSAGLHDPLPVSSSFPPGVFSLPNFLHINGTSCLSVYWVK